MKFCMIFISILLILFGSNYFYRKIMKSPQFETFGKAARYLVFIYVICFIASNFWEAAFVIDKKGFEEYLNLFFKLQIQCLFSAWGLFYLCTTLPSIYIILARLIRKINWKEEDVELEVISKLPNGNEEVVARYLTKIWIKKARKYH